MRNNKIRTYHKKSDIRLYMEKPLKVFKRLSFAHLISYLLLFFAALFIVFYAMSVIYYNSIIEKQVAVLQNEAVLISAEFSGYASLDKAESDRMESRLKSYSALDQIRIRVVNPSFRVVIDTYNADKDKTILNSKVFTIFDTPKTISEYDKYSGKLEAATPIYNSNDKMIAVLIVDLDSSYINSIIQDVSDNGYLLWIIIITLVIILEIGIIHYLDRPYKKVVSIMEDVAAGHTDKRIPAKGFTEIVELGGHFNTIMDHANELDKSRAEFVSNVSHELRTPITSMKVLAESLNTNEDVPIELYREFMQDIVNEIDRESKIIEDLLSLARLDKATSSLNLSQVNLNDLLEMVLKRLKPIAQKKNIEVLFESFRPVVAQIDEVKMTLVISNLVENAIKYNVDDGWVHVSLNADHMYFYIRVEDSGIGIPQESQNKIFERFYRVDKARSRQTGGTGLGLAIVKNIVLMHHGIIKVYSEENIGTTFTMRVPLNYVE